ncbi:phosphoinositide phospholipase C-1 [Coleophoma crateriformis]|uniref:Phosphoinositide phospholipase C n=1 Tax=Coleophoma crateriformis TaxID=565419 RepID=A0A3D8QYY8_9HELO|nr:phosphoinositide phospholipase C-1 [Coleophoma crateriformis]
MAFLTSKSHNKISLHTALVLSTMISPSHHKHLRPLTGRGGGLGDSEIPAHQTYLCEAIQARLKEVFEKLCAPRSTITKEQFGKFLSEIQNQTIELDQDEYKLEEFLQVIYYNGGFQAIKPVKAEDKDLTKPISNYYISSSHNTYLSGNQLASKSSTEAYKNVLTRGCRCIEIDVHNGESPDSVSDKSSTFSTSPKPEHKRHLSGSTLSSRAGAMLEKMEEKYVKAKYVLGEKTGKDAHTQADRSLPTESTLSLPLQDPIDRPPSSRSMRIGEPLVLHGWTFTTPVGFRAVCRAIKETAFVNSKLPIIVSLEVHADLEQQEIMVDIMKEEWRGFLVDQPHPECDPNQRLPRLEELTEKILIKVKKASADPIRPIVGASTLAPRDVRDHGDSGQSGSEDERATGKKKVKIHPSLSNLGIYTHSEHFTSFESRSAKKPPHVFSIGEKQILELHEKKQSDMFAHNRDYFMRAYPAGFRFDSSNLDPSVFWRKGVQMVALNWQMWDEGMMLNEGMFAGEHGWVLKPSGYRSHDATTNQADAIQHKTLDLKVTIFGGQHVPLPEHEDNVKDFYPFIKCELHVEKQEERTGEPIEGGGRAKEGEYKQRTAYKKGDHPDFGREGVSLEFMGIPKVVEELSFIRFKIEDKNYVNDTLAAWACIRIDRLQHGYRFVNLLNAKGQPTEGLLLIKIEKTLR